MQLLLAKTYNATRHNVRGWLASEKLDGVRAYWDGLQLWTRNGKLIHAPAHWTRHLPDHAIDGELTLGRGQFQATVSAVRCNQPDHRWSDVQYAVFDAPAAYGTFRSRLDMLRHSWRASHCPPSWSVVPHREIAGDDDVRALLHEFEARGGEGVMLRDPESHYEHKRSGTLLKVKSMSDLDAAVIGYTAGRGQHAGRVGALICRLADGSEFQCGSGLAISDREHPPAIGATVIVQHQGFTRDGLPRFPIFKGVRAE